MVKFKKGSYLRTDIQVVVKVLDISDSDEQDYINEVVTMGKINHINIVCLLGFCADGFHRALVYNFFPNGSLQKSSCLHQTTKKLSLGGQSCNK